jgi:hypothetical protein
MVSPLTPVHISSMAPFVQAFSVGFEMRECMAEIGLSEP